MTGTEYTGEFWLPNQPEHRVAGGLHVDGEGGRLTLSGSITGVSLWAGLSRPRTLFGSSGRRLVTVAGAQRVQGSVLGDVWSAESVLTGAHHAEPANAVYDCARFEVANLGHWFTQSSALRVEDADDRPKLSLIYEPQPTTFAGTPFGEVKLAQNFRRTGDGVISLGIAQTWEVEMRFTPACPLRDILHRCEQVRRLVTFGLGTTVIPRQLTLILRASSVPTGSQTRPHRLYRRGWDPAATDREADDSSLMLGLFDEQTIGGIAGVAAWFNTADEYDTATRQLAATVEAHLPPDMRLVVVCSAAEAYERVAAGKRKGDVRRALLKLITAEASREADLWGDPTIRDDGAGARWVERVVAARNAVVYHGGEGTDPLRLRAYAEHVYLMVLRALLKETGTPPAALERVASELTPPGFREHGPWGPGTDS